MLYCTSSSVVVLIVSHISIAWRWAKGPSLNLIGHMENPENLVASEETAESFSALDLKSEEELLNTVGWNDREDNAAAASYKSIFDFVESDEDDDDVNNTTPSESQNSSKGKICNDEDDALFGTEFCAVERSADRNVVQLTDPHSGLSLRISRALLDQWNNEQALLQSEEKTSSSTNNSQASHGDKTDVDVL